MRFVRLVGSLLVGSLGFSGCRVRPREWRRSDLKFGLPALAVSAAGLTAVWLILQAFYARIVATGFILRRPDVVFFTSALFGWLVLFFAALAAARSLFLIPADNELLRSLPCRPVTLSLARFIALYILLLPLELYLFLPALVSYLRYAAAGWSLAAGIAAQVLCVPLFPAALAACLSAALRRLPRFSRWAAPLEIAGVTFLVLLLAALETALQHALVGVNRASDLIFPVQLAIFLGRLMEVIPPAAWLASAFRPGEAPVSLLFSLLFAFAFAALAVWLAARSFEKDGAPRRRWTARAGRPGRSPAGRASPFVALMFREWSLFLTRPGLAFRAVLRLLALPAFLLCFAAAAPRETIAVFSAFVSSSPWAALAVIGLLLLLSDVSFLAATGFSREGRLFGVSLTVPLDGALQLKAKLAFLLCLSLPPSGLALALVYLLFPVPLETLVCAVPGVAAFLVFSVSAGLYLDLRRPSFSRGPSLFGQNTAAVLALAAEAATLAILGAVAAGALAAGCGALAAGFLCVTLLAAADILLLPRLFRYASARYARELEA
jgi:hypothetical protein